MLTPLNDAQREAVTYVKGPLLILAGPGSGKTRTITHRIAWLLEQGIPPWKILALTFTNYAAEEMRSRLAMLVPGENVWASTFHRFCARLLRQNAELVGLERNYTIYDTADSRAALKRTLAELDLETLHYSVDRLGEWISNAKNRFIAAEHFQPHPGDPLESIMGEIFPAYQQRLLASNAVDFDDLLLHAATLLRENPELRSDFDQRYEYILVDEYQDTNLAQYAIVRALSIDYPNLCVTGDPDQSIYGWRGANLKNILDFEKDYPGAKIVRLEENYRSTQRILRVAGALIQNNVKRKRKELFTSNQEGVPVRLTIYPSHRDEAESIAERIRNEVASGCRRPRDFAIFYRVNALSLTFENALRNRGVPYQVVRGLEFFQRQEIKNVLAYLQLINNPRNNVALLRIINTPPRGIGAKTVSRLSRYAAEHRLPLLEAARGAAEIPELSKRAVAAVNRFVGMFDRLSQSAHADLEEIVGLVLSESGYQEQLKHSDSPQDASRLENVEELLTVARQFDEQYPSDAPLESFLEKASLVSDTDDLEEGNDRVSLMSLHASKGLEFPVVFLTAVEERLLPHESSKHHPDALEEERRLCFVGMTRAEEELWVSLAREREFRGRRGMAVPSSFLFEFPHEELDYTDLSRAAHYEVDVPAEPFVRPPTRPSPAPAAVESGLEAFPLSTAAELAGTQQDQSEVSVDAFHQDMPVKHPKYGLGKIVALSGRGAKRKATVQFASAAGEKNFVLAHSDLRPARRV